MFAGKPIIGLVGGIGGGKSFVAGLFAELGCAVMSADEQVRAIYGRPAVKATLRQWWGDEVMNTAGEVDRRWLARRVFSDDSARRRLEALVHPLVIEMRRQEMNEAVQRNAQVIAFVWDTPLLLESGSSEECDVVVFVEAPEDQRRARVEAQRGWDAGELGKREKLQLPLDNKRQIADYVIGNTAEADFARSQVREVLSRIVAGTRSP